MPFSERSGFDRDPNPLSRALDSRHKRGGDVLDLTVSNPTQAGIAYDAEGLRRALASSSFLRYEPDPFGAPSARQVVCETWARIGRHVAPEQVLITSSTSEAYAFLFKLLCDPGDEVLIPAPSYPLFEHLARFEGVRAVPYPLAFDGAWHVDFARLRERVGPRSRAVVVVNPNNPTGHFVRLDELVELARLGLPVISDEVFSSYPLHVPPGAAQSALEGSDLLVFALSGLSKLAALPQLKLAWITTQGPPDLAREALGRLELIADAFLSPSAPVQLALGEIVRLAAPSRDQIQQRVAANARALGALVAGSPVTSLPVEGGWYAVLRLPRTQSEESWALALLDRGVLVQPGYFYDFPGEAYAVVSLLTREAELQEGITRLVRAASAP